MRILLVEEDGSSNENDGVQKGLKQYELFEVILFNLNSSEVSKLSVLYKIRAAGITIPVLILTNNQSAQDKIKAFDNGADDYLTKPVDLAELSARIRALQRRYSNNRASPLLTYRDIELNPNSLTVTLRGEDVSFSRREFSLLQKLLENVGHVVSRNSLNQCLYGWNDEIDSNALEVHVHNIRKKLGNSQFIRTIRGVGYMVEKENL
ncbi:hypothetical protein FQR65_LT05268 [Abscondita terminalis]|nr:hypothetical protein FQR65_LT05268 [Abscondita terminalis]